MKKYLKSVILLLVVGAVASSFVYFNYSTARDASTSPQVSQELKATLNIDDKTFDISSFIGKSALEATKANIEIQESGTGQNAFVTGINGKVADTKKKEFWELVINDTSAQVGAGSHIIQNGDSILWKLNTY